MHTYLPPQYMILMSVGVDVGTQVILMYVNHHVLCLIHV